MRFLDWLFRRTPNSGDWGDTLDRMNDADASDRDTSEADTNDAPDISDSSDGPDFD